MGKHSRRRSGYLPKVAAGAAPVALLFAGSASAFAAQTDLVLPLDRIALPVDHRHDGGISRDVSTSSEGGTSVARGALGITRGDTVTERLGDVELGSGLDEAVHAEQEVRKTATRFSTRKSEAVARNGQHVLRLGQVAVSTANDQRLTHDDARASALSLRSPAAFGQDERRVGAGEGTRHGVWLSDGVDALSENSEQLDGGLRRSAGTGRFAGDLAGVLAARRSSGQAADLGDAAAVGTTSEQYATGQFLGTLDGAGVLRGDLGQLHALGGQAGPVSGLLTTQQAARLGEDGGLGDSISGDLGTDHVVRVRGGVTTSVSGRLPDASLVQDHTVSVAVLDESPARTSWTFTAPPLSLRPH